MWLRIHPKFSIPSLPSLNSVQIATTFKQMMTISSHYDDDSLSDYPLTISIYPVDNPVYKFMLLIEFNE